MNEVIYICEIDQDVDDIIAVDYLHKQNCLKGIVLDPLPKTDLGFKRVKQIKEMGINVYTDIPVCDYIFVGGAFTKLAKYLKSHKCKTIVANGGFVGDNLSTNPISKFKGKMYVRTFNFNMDVQSTVFVLNSDSYEEIYLIGKNVCHNKINTQVGIWKNCDFLKQYNLNDEKLLHDLLMVSEGLKIINGEMDKSLLIFKKTNCIYENNKLDGIYTKWGSEAGTKANSAIGWKSLS